MRTTKTVFVFSLSLVLFIGAVQTSSWTKIPTPNDVLVRALDMVNSTDGWAVGRHGSIIRWNGTGWTGVASPTYAHLVSVDVVTSNEVYAVAQQTTTPSVTSVICWDGTSWKTMVTPPGYYNDLHMMNSTDGWAVGNGGAIMRWNGTGWCRQEPVSNPWELPTGAVIDANLTSPLESIDMVTSTDGWAVGWRGAIVHWNGTCWSLVDCPQTFTYRTIWSIDMVSSSDGWAVGDGGRIIRWDGTRWNNVTSPTKSHLFSVDMTASDDGWAVGSDGAVIRWDGNEWKNVTGPTGAWLHCVKMTTSTEGWILGADGMYRLQLEEEETSDFPIEYLVTTAAVITIVAALVFTKKRTSKPTKQQ